MGIRFLDGGAQRAKIPTSRARAVAEIAIREVAGRIDHVLRRRRARRDGQQGGDPEQSHQMGPPTPTAQALHDTADVLRQGSEVLLEAFTVFDWLLHRGFSLSLRQAVSYLDHSAARSRAASFIQQLDAFAQ
jgi:transposase-like protein